MSYFHNVIFTMMSFTSVFDLQKKIFTM